MRLFDLAFLPLSDDRTEDDDPLATHLGLMMAVCSAPCPLANNIAVITPDLRS